MIFLKLFFAVLSIRKLPVKQLNADWTIKIHLEKHETLTFFEG